jgi:hypothetical protein
VVIKVGDAKHSFCTIEIFMSQHKIAAVKSKLANAIVARPKEFKTCKHDPFVGNEGQVVAEELTIIESENCCLCVMCVIFSVAFKECS